MTTLKESIARLHGTRRATKLPRAARLPVQEQEEIGDVRIFRSAGLNAASVALPSDIKLETRAARMNAFWQALVGFQDRDVYVVATCAGEERE